MGLIPMDVPKRGKKFGEPTWIFMLDHGTGVYAPGVRTRKFALQWRLEDSTEPFRDAVMPCGSVITVSRESRPVLFEYGVYRLRAL